MKISLTPYAKRELMRVHRYYERKSLGLGDRFLDEVGEVLRKITQSPRTLAPFGHQLWRQRLERFRYGVLYYIKGDIVYVVVVGHLSRGPAFWRKMSKRSR